MTKTIDLNRVANKITSRKLDPDDSNSETPVEHVATFATTTAKRTSPIRLNPSADKLEENVSDRDDQVPIRRKLTIPTTSQKKKETKKPDNPPDPITPQTERRKIQRVSANLTKVLSNSR